MDVPEAESCVVCDEMSKNIAEKSSSTMEFVLVAERSLKGNQAPIKIFRVRKAKASHETDESFKAATRRMIVGYDEEKSDILSLIEDFKRLPSLTVLFIEGTTGCGKSLFGDFIQWEMQQREVVCW
jgi:DNA-binding NtrC family response regulator